MLLITVIATAVGALFARMWYDEPASASPPAVIPSSSAVPRDDQPGSGVVKGTPDATGHPMYDTVRELLQRYFDSINTKDYAAWQDTVIPERVARQPQDKWLADYRTTRDGNIVIYRIELAAGPERRAAGAAGGLHQLERGLPADPAGRRVEDRLLAGQRLAAARGVSPVLSPSPEPWS